MTVSSRFLLAAGFGFLSCCSTCERCEKVPNTAIVAVAQDVGLESWRAANRSRYQQAISNARVWLDNLDVDPTELRSRGIKGKKKLAEQIDAYARLWQVAPDDEKDYLVDRVRYIARVTLEPGYHDLLTISDKHFKQDSTSYLRIALLLERMGIGTDYYKKEILRVEKRLNAQMRKRGPHQQRVFHTYYAHFGLKEPFPLAKALENGVIARRMQPLSMKSNDVYSLTHEVYALYDYGEKLDADPFTQSDKQYLLPTIEHLIQNYIHRDNPDIVGELVECLHYLRMYDSPQYRSGVEFLFSSQNSDGSWGRYKKQEKRMGDFVQQGYVLHTTLVAIGALTAIFDRPMLSVLVADASQQ